MKDIKQLINTTIWGLCEQPLFASLPVHSERMLALDTNESPFNAPDNRLPDATHTQLRETLSALHGIRPEAIGIGPGTEAIIDALMRTFCQVGKHSVVVATPARNVFARRAAVNQLDCRQVPLNDDFSFSAEKVINTIGSTTKMIYLCSPNVPSGHPVSCDEIRLLLDLFDGIVVVDESYIDFARGESMVKAVASHPNLVVLQSFSRAWSLAAWRVAAVYAVPEVQRALQVVLPRHSVSEAAEKAVVQLAAHRYEIDRWVNRVSEERQKVMTAIHLLPVCEEVVPSLCNFFLVRLKNCHDVHHYLLRHHLRVKDVSNEPLCDNCLRITVGLPQENNRLLGLLRRYCEVHFKADL